MQWPWCVFFFFLGKRTNIVIFVFTIQHNMLITNCIYKWKFQTLHNFKKEYESPYHKSDVIYCSSAILMFKDKKRQGKL